MKFTYIKISLVFGLLISLSGCSIDDVVPQNALEENNVIRDEASAIKVLNRIYTTYRGTAGSSLRTPLLHPTITARLGAAAQEIQLVRPDSEGIADHNVMSNSSIVTNIYRSEYFTINTSNFFIELVGNGDANVDETRKNELLAEARFFRGYSHFNLLRVFGQFYDLNSQYGVVNAIAPYRSNEARPRNTVQENFDFIISDLQFAADNGTDNREHFYISATTARAALAKVQLYMGDYASAATNALSVINNTDGYALAGNYSDIFNTKYGSETIFAPFVGDIVEGDISTNAFRNSGIVPHPYFKDIADEQDGIPGDGSIDNTTGYDPRYSFVFSSLTDTPKYPFAINQVGGGNTVNMLRMAEMYLIYAEAEARRPGGNLNNALDRLNDIRNRAGIAPKILTDKATLLLDIRNEKILELFKETGESWFDFVRYDRLGDINATVLRPTISGLEDLIFPIPQAALAGNNQLIPNP